MCAQITVHTHFTHYKKPGPENAYLVHQTGMELCTPLPLHRCKMLELLLRGQRPFDAYG